MTKIGRLSITDCTCGYDKAACPDHAAKTAPSKPFYWVAAPSLMRGDRMAPTGWYQWLDNGLVYLGETILDPPDRISDDPSTPTE